MTKVVIIEDEKPAARRLQRMLTQLGITTEVMLHSVSDAVEWFRNNPDPELIFLDIQLSDGLSFEIFEQVSPKSAIIFTTAYDEYALKAFKLNSIDYLLKPIDDEELEAAITKFDQNRKAEGLDLHEIKTMLAGQSSLKTYKTRFTAQVGQHLKLVEASDIACFYSENKSTYMHCFNGRNYPIDIPLEQLQDELDPEKFYRVNRKCIINIKAIEDILTYSNSRLEVKVQNFADFQIIVSRERVKDFKAWLNN
nr:LytTR family DNA-binding domain-containing protein [Christiangramia portivictoriae]